MMGRIRHQCLAAILLVGLTSSVLGQYCSRRGCCPGRDDDCHVAFYDTLCYCDEFCKRTDSDCCPDYYSSLCHFSPAPSTLAATPTPTTSGDACIFQGNAYGLGDTVQDNCNACVCEVDGLFGGLEFICTTETCAIGNITEINLKDLGWEAGNYSEFWGKTAKDIRLYHTGTLQPPGGVAGQSEVDIQKAENLPASFDVRDTKWGDLVGGIQDQGDCGSSWAASTIALASDRLAIQSSGTITTRLSMQHLISCNNRNQLGCNGGYTDRAYWFLRKRGVVTEECYPLQSGQSKETFMDKLNCQLGYLESYPCPNGDVTSNLQRSSPPYRIGMNQEEIMFEIQRNGPVQATFQVKDDFFSYLTGVYRFSGDDGTKVEGFHSVRILGWGTDIDVYGRELPFWLCANSWGTEWGEDGYFRIQRGKNECEIESFVVGVWGQVDAGLSRL